MGGACAVADGREGAHTCSSVDLPPAWAWAHPCHAGSSLPSGWQPQPPCWARAPTVDGGLLEEALGVGGVERLDGRHGLDVQVLHIIITQETQKLLMQGCQNDAAVSLSGPGSVQQATAAGAAAGAGAGRHRGSCRRGRMRAGCASMPLPASGYRSTPAHLLLLTRYLANSGL